MANHGFRCCELIDAIWDHYRGVLGRFVWLNSMGKVTIWNVHHVYDKMRVLMFENEYIQVLLEEK